MPDEKPFPPGGGNARGEPGGRDALAVEHVRIIAEELRRQGWSEAHLRQPRKSDPVKLALAARRRRETILTVGWIAQRLEMGTRKSAASKLHRWVSQEAGQSKGKAKTLV